MFFRGRPLVHALLVFGLLSGCSPHRYVDDDATCSRAKPLPPVVLVKDELNVAFGDRTDCKQVKYFKDAIAKVEYRVGTAFEKHDVRGLLTVYDSDGQVIDQRAVDPSIFKFEFEFDVVAQKPYYVEFKATEGAYAYQAQVRYAKKDPCAKCTENEECVDTVDGGKGCRPLGCDPPCDEDAGEICEERVCKSACNPPCRRSFTCNVDTRECERRTSSCSPRCKRGFYCSRGRCRKRKSPARCAGGCPPGKICQKGVCIRPGGTPKCPACPNPTDVCSAATKFKCISSGSGVNTGPIVGRVASTVRAGQGSILYLNRGKKHGVKRGQVGKLCGKYKFMVTSAFSTRSKARTNHSLEELGDCKSVVIKR